MTDLLAQKNRTYGAIAWDGTAWSISEIEPHVAIRLKQVFPRIAKTAREPFVMRGGSRLAADLQWFLSRYPMRISGDDAARLVDGKTLFETEQNEIGNILSRNWRPPEAAGFRGNQRPYDYQMQAAELARRTGRLLLMDEMGLGKTVSAIATVVDPHFLPALVVPQTHLPAQWAEKIAEFTNLSTHIVKRTTPYELPPADIIICPYSKLAGWIDYAEQSGFKSVVFDEIQELRSGTGTAKGQAAKAFAAQAQVVLGLSGTPIYNYGEEIWRICDFLEEGCLGEWFDFVREWCSPGPGGKWIVTDPAALGTFLRENHLALRRTRLDVGHERKFANTIIHEIPYDSDVLDDEAAEMRALAHQVIAGSFTERGQAAREFDMRMRHATGLAKAPHVATFVKMLIEAGAPVVLCGWHRDVYDIWRDRLSVFNPVFYTGSESPKQKQDAIYLTTDGGSDPELLGVLGLKSSQSDGILDPLSAPRKQDMDATRIRQLAERYLSEQAAAGGGKPPSAAPRLAPKQQGSLL